MNFSKYGIMAGMVTHFDEAGRFDENSFLANVGRCIEAGAHTIYTTGGAAEFYSLELGDFKTLVKAYAKATAGWRGNRQIGCSWISTEGIVSRIQTCLEHGIDTVQLTVPFWTKLNRDEVTAFFSEVARACPGVKILHYNAVQSKNVLTGKDYGRLAREIPNLVGTKITTPSFMEWMEIVINSPELDHCCCEGSMVPAAMTGAAGVASAWFLSNPAWFKQLYKDCVAGRWEEAMRQQKRMHEAYHGLIYPFYNKYELNDATIDKALGHLGGFLCGSMEMRNPLRPMDGKVFQEFSARMKEDFPDLMSRP